MSILAKFGLWVVPLGVVLAVLPLLKPDVEYDQVLETCNRTLGSYKLHCPEISSDLKELFKTHGVVVLRQVLPPELLEDLLEEVRCRFRPKTETSRNWAVSARNVWMDSEVFAQFVLHQDSPLGCLAAQLIPGASTIRYGHEEVTMMVEGQNGTEGWQTDLESKLPERLTDSVPLVRFFLPLIRQNLSNGTGGSVSVFPVNHFKRLRKYYPPCFEENGRLKGTCLAMNNLEAAPALAPGDMLLYSPLMPYRTQRLLSGSRVAVSGTLYEPKLLIPWVKEVQNLTLPAAPGPDLGMVCWDRSKKQWHGNLDWQSAATHGITEDGTACFPQVYPQTQESEVATRLSNELVNPYGPRAVTLRRFLHSFPVNKALGVVPSWFLDWLI